MANTGYLHTHFTSCLRKRDGFILGVEVFHVQTLANVIKVFVKGPLPAAATGDH